MSGPGTAPTRTLSEHDSKALLARHGVAVPDERLLDDAEAAGAAAEALGFPVVAKLCGETIAHKTERGLVRLGLASRQAVEEAASELLAAAREDDGTVGVLVAPMLAASRELICGVATDPQFGLTVMVGIGGVLAEAIEDVAIRLVPITELDAAEMLDELAAQKLLGPFRGEPALDRAAATRLLVGLSDAASAIDGLVSIDLNPVLIVDGAPIPVDALVELGTGAGAGDG